MIMKKAQYVLPTYAKFTSKGGFSIADLMNDVVPAMPLVKEDIPEDHFSLWKPSDPRVKRMSPFARMKHDNAVRDFKKRQAGPEADPSAKAKHALSFLLARREYECVCTDYTTRPRPLIGMEETQQLVERFLPLIGESGMSDAMKPYLDLFTSVKRDNAYALVRLVFIGAGIELEAKSKAKPCGLYFKSGNPPVPSTWRAPCAAVGYGTKPHVGYGRYSGTISPKVLGEAIQNLSVERLVIAACKARIDIGLGQAQCQKHRPLPPLFQVMW